jgi:hypothetical protein
MIRVDEIYNNTLWEWVKKNKLDMRLFFCDPPGTSAPINLFNHGADYENNNGNETNYIFLHDQEPIHMDVHEDLFNDVILRNEDISPSPQGHIITSEKDSEFLDEIVKIYKWKPHYYFYHGWSSLDWYRGYNRTFLIPRARNRTPSKTFISPNRIIGGKRDHRVLFMYHIFKNSLVDNHITVPNICPEENINIRDIAQKYMSRYPDIINIFNDAELPYLFNEEETQLMTSCWITNFDESADSLFYVPTETVYFGKRLHLTEKSFKPIVLEMPFILMATAGSLKYLRSYGFKTFDGIIDESYDNETDDFKRIEMVVKLISDIDKMSKEEKQDLHIECVPIVEHNYNHFYNGNFENILWEELTNMMDELKND